MRKQEYIHLHDLLVEFARYLTDQENVPTESFFEYNARETRPVNFTETKQAHHDAVVALASTIEAEIEQSRTDRHEFPAR